MATKIETETKATVAKDARRNMVGFLYIALTILFTVYGQVVIKWQVSQAGAFPPEFNQKILFILHLLLTPWVISALAGAFLASLFWMAAMTQFELSFAYPFMSLAFVLVLILSTMLFHEQVTWTKVAGTLIIISGLVVLTR
jgi:multidrug transporter EmrE-like cation transporter